MKIPDFIEHALYESVPQAMCFKVVYGSLVECFIGDPSLRQDLRVISPSPIITGYMSHIKEKLDLLEARLADLIEGKLSRWFHSKELDGNISKLVVREMYARSSIDQADNLTVPEAFTILANPEDPRVWEDESMLCDQLSEIILQAGEEAGVRFLSRPQVRFIPDRELPQGEFRIQASVSENSINETATMNLANTEAEDLLPPGAFLIVGSTTIYPLNKPVINLGRRPDNHLVIDDERVSRLHAQLRSVNGRFVIFDLGSSGGTFVNGIRQNQCPLSPGDVISLAGVTLVYGQDPDFKSTPTPLNAEPDSGETQPLTPFYPEK